jgi:hypothetical protein
MGVDCISDSRCRTAIQSKIYRRRGVGGDFFLGRVEGVASWTVPVKDLPFSPSPVDLDLDSQLDTGCR